MMQHYIIVKWNDTIKDKSETADEVRKLYAEATEIPGIHRIAIKKNIIARDNRYDLMIILDMDESSLEAWDNSELHHRWKTDYGHMIDKKAIFDAAD